MRRSDRLSPIIEIVQDGRLHLARDIAERLPLYQCEQFIVILILSLRLAFQSKASACTRADLRLPASSSAHP